MAMQTKDIVVIAWTMSQFMIIFVANIYFMANLSHPNDTKFGKSWSARIFVFTGLSLVLIPIIYVF
jgi:hypothetical protein